MQMRHQAFVIGDDIEQIAVGLDQIDRRQPQPLQLRHLAQDQFGQRAERGRTAKSLP